jgi:hypothetical protein
VPTTMLSDGHLRAIGRLIVLWSNIEAAMEFAICRLYSVDPTRGLVFTANIGFQSRVAMLRIAANGGAISEPARAVACLSLLKRVERAYPLRNNVAHGLWAGTADPTVARHMTVRAKGNQLRCISETRTTIELEANADQLGVVAADFDALNDALGAYPMSEAQESS